ncbi:MAG: hypothetical protein R3C19_06810 [Planctomycetaceae bacterium]
MRFSASLSAFVMTVLVCVPGFADEITLKADNSQHWYRGNMHTHSLWSDGDDYPEMIASWYLERDYDFLVFTDHNVLLQGERWSDIEKNAGGRAAFEKLQAKFPADWIKTRTTDDRHEVRLKTFDEVFERLAVPGEFLLIQGEEITDRFQNLPVHMCATNTKELLPPLHGDSVAEVMQRNIDAARSRRERSGVKTLVHLNHPNFGWGVTAEDLMQVVGEDFFEVYNGHPSVNNSGDETHASTERMWDIINTWRLAKLKLPMMYGLATDDGHHYHRQPAVTGSQPGRGWVMVLAERLDPDTLVESLEAGRFYSSSGVFLDEIRVTADSLFVDVREEQGVTYRIDFIGTPRDFDDTTAPAVADEEKAAGITRRYSDDVGAVLKSVDGSSATYEFTGDELYVRAVVTSSRKHPNPSEPGEFEKAWVQPTEFAD